MCEPVSALVALSVASTAASIVSEARAYKSQEAAIHQQLAQSEREINTKASAEVNERLREARREQGRVRVAAGEAGLRLSGSVGLLLQDSLMQAGLQNERILGNRGRELTAVRSEANSMLSRNQRPTLLGAGLRLASAGMQGYASGRSLKVARDRAISGAVGQTR